MPTIIEVDTRTFLAHYIPAQDRVEISQYLNDFKELHDFCLQHELSHAELGPYSLRHLWVDIRDRTKFLFNNILSDQYAEFREPLESKTWKAAFFLVTYNLVGGITQGLLMLLAIPLLFFRRVPNKRDKLKQWASAILE